MIGSLVLHPKTEALTHKLTKRLPQGLIIHGPSGSGVLALAQTLSSSIHADTFIVRPKKSVKGEMVIDMNEGSVVIEDIRKLYEQTRTHQPRRQVYIIDTGEKYMTVGAQNAFLKLLEEPRNGVHFIIATHHINAVLPTIISRSQQLAILLATPEQTLDFIRSLGVSDETKQARLAFIANGRPALVRRLVDNDDFYEARAAIVRDGRILITGTTIEKAAIIHKYRDNRPDALTLLDDINQQLRIVLSRQTETRLVKEISRHMDSHVRISMNANIRLQLAADML